MRPRPGHGVTLGPDSIRGAVLESFKRRDRSTERHFIVDLERLRGTVKPEQTFCLGMPKEVALAPPPSPNFTVSSFDLQNGSKTREHEIAENDGRSSHAAGPTLRR